MAKLSDIEREVRAEWRKRPDDKKTGHDVYVFFNELCKDRPELLDFKCAGDKYQRFHAFLRELVRID